VSLASCVVDLCLITGQDRPIQEWAEMALLGLIIRKNVWLLENLRGMSCQCYSRVGATGQALYIDRPCIYTVCQKREFSFSYRATLC